MISGATLLCGIVAAVVVRPWRVRPRSLTPVVAPASAAWTLPPVPAGALWGGAVVAGVVVHPMVGIAVLFWPALRRFRRRRIAQSIANRALARTLPEVADLILLGLGAGLTPRAALNRCQAWLPPPFDLVFAEALRRAAAGESFVVALEAAAVDLDDTSAPLIRAIVAAEQTPGSVALSLVRVGDEARRRRRVDAQERARRLPVTMLLPLVLCVLPAFGLLAVVPLLLGSLRDLGVGP